VEKLEEKCKYLRNIWTPIKAYELFKFHYNRRFRNSPVSNPWHLNLGKLVVPDVFLNVELLQLLAKQYNPSLKAICNPQGEPIIHLLKNEIYEVFDLDDLFTVPIV